MNKAVFLDKDGTLVDILGYPKIIPSDLLLQDDVIEGLRYIQNKGYKLFIVSNQPWIAKGRLKKTEVDQIFHNLIAKLKSKDIIIDEFVYCPHKLSNNCDCKKPGTKLILDLVKKHNIDISKSYFVGDMDNDINAGKNAGLKTILVLTGRGNDFKDKVKPDYIIKNINSIKEVLN